MQFKHLLFIIFIGGVIYLFYSYSVGALMTNGLHYLLKSTGAAQRDVELAQNETELENQINTLIEEENYCLETSDCQIENFACPFGDKLVNNNANLSIIEQGLDKYAQFSLRCNQDETKTIKPKEIECQEFKCVQIKEDLPYVIDI